jgi:hypothetical protein
LISDFRNHCRGAQSARLFGILISLLAFASRSAAVDSRSWEPLVLRGAQLPQLLGVREDRLEVLAIRHGACVPIPFQVDKRRADGRYAMPDGPYPIIRDQPGTLRDSDELVLMAADMASPMPENPCLRPHTLEIKATDPLGGTPRYAYLDAAGSPRRTSHQYIYYDAAHDRIESDFYRIGLTSGWPADFALQHHIQSGAPNLIDRFKVRTSARILRLFTYRMDEDDIHNRLLAWKAGPVRVLRTESHSVDLLFGIKSPELRSQGFLYRNYLEAPIRVNFAWVPRLILNSVSVRVDVDYLNLSGFLLTWSEMTSPPVVIGSNSPAEQALEQPGVHLPIDWMAMRSDDRLMLQTLRPSADLKLINRMLYYCNSNVPDPPERYPGEHPGVGYITSGYRNLSSGSHTFDSLFIIAPAICDPRALMREIGTPLAVTVHQIEKSH